MGRSQVQGQPTQIVCETPPHLQNNQSKMDWRCGSSNRAPALRGLQGSNPSNTEKKKMVPGMYRYTKYGCIMTNSNCPFGSLHETEQPKD
jgi:hypothetical protein